MKSFTQAIFHLKEKLTWGDVSDSSSHISENFVCDSRPQDSIGLAVLYNLSQTCNRLSGFDQFVFLNRDYSQVIVGLGTACERVQKDALMFLGCRFSERVPSMRVTPRVLLTSSRNTWPAFEVRINLDPGRASRKEAIVILDALSPSFVPRSLNHLIPACTGHADTGLSKELYKREVEKLLEGMRSYSDGVAEKVVLARQVTFHTTDEVNPFALLFEVVSTTENSDKGKRYIVAIKEASGEAFISLTPERLCYVSNTHLETEALAGTWSVRDEVLKMSDKLNREHQYVSDHIGSVCSKIGSVKKVKADSVALGDLVHCRQRIKLRSDEIRGLELLEWTFSHLHPTPAVAGFPRQKALECIEEKENFERGLFAGVFGFWNPASQTGELCVLLRSASVVKNSVKLYAGAGIVLGSVPEAEWEEMHLKMNQFRSILLRTRRRIRNLSDLAIEQLVCQTVSLFVVCPGSRSTPLTVAVHRNSVAKSVIIHDERSAGFFAVGAARAGELVAVIVTSGTAVANLMPAVCEAREAGLALILLTADRPARSWDVGENQTIKQMGMFSGIVGFQKSFSVQSAKSVCADICFGIGHVARNRRQCVHLNFEFEKSDLAVMTDENDNFPLESFAGPKNKIDPYTTYPSTKDSQILIPQNVIHAVRSGNCLFVVGELGNPDEAISVRSFVERFGVPCLAEACSLIPPGSANVVSCIDRIFPVQQEVSNKIQCVVRLGGALISTAIEEWISSIQTHYVRVHSISFPRHDPFYAADVYIDTSIVAFLISLERQVVSCNITSASSDLLLYFSDLSSTIESLYSHALESIPEFNEPLIAHTLAAVSEGSFFLSSSMPCRDFAVFGSVGIASSSWPYRLVSCNRGANGIDGVISSACGYSACITGKTILLIGDVAALHDLSGLAIALNVHPGASHGTKPNLKIVCINNSGGAIFSFLPIHKHKDVFHPFFDTPHNMSLCDIANAMKPECAVKVRDVRSLRSALSDPRIELIECVDLPSHESNVEIHDKIRSHVSSLRFKVS